MITLVFLMLAATLVLDYKTRCGENCGACKNIFNGYFEFESWDAACVECTSSNFILSEDFKSCIKTCPMSTGPKTIKDAERPNIAR